MLSLLLSVALVVLGNDGVVRVSDPSGSVASARVHFDLPVGREWRTVARVGAGLSAHSEWAPVGDGVTVPWYALLSDGTRTFGFGVKVQPKAMCCWRVVPGGVDLLLDLRAGGQPLELGSRTIDACTVVRLES